MEKALDTLDGEELNGRKIKLTEDKGRGRSKYAVTLVELDIKLIGINHNDSYLFYSF